MREDPQIRRSAERSRPSGGSADLARSSQRALVIASLVRCPGPDPGGARRR